METEATEANPVTTDEKEILKQEILSNLVHHQAHTPESATRGDWWRAMCIAVRSRMLERASVVHTAHTDQNVRRVYYLSLEYLMGRLLENNLVNMGLLDDCREAIKELGQDFEDLVDAGTDLGLGNGGLGRLAACFLDSLATLDLPAVGYGINYEFGLFRQEFVDGKQVESPDEWRRFGNPWEICRPEYSVEVPVYGRVENQFDELGQGRPVWTGTRSILGVPWDVPIVGWGGSTVNYLRLWESTASRDFDLDVFNRGGYVDAVREKAESESISKVLYPNDSTEGGKELRLVQQYFFVACSLQDIISRHRRSNDTWDSLPDKAAIQLNDTHPAIAVVELMRILIDDEMLPWDQAWEICTKTFAYTNHTLLPEALEKWSVPLFERVLPRHLQIIFEINRRFLDEVVAKEWPGDTQKLAELSLIEEGAPQQIRMAYLAVVGSHTVNGVAALHTELLKKHLFATFHALYPGKIQNKTNGITPRRWLKACNPELSSLIDQKIGNEWPGDLDRLRELENYADDPDFQQEFMAIKRRNKERLAALIKDECGIEVSPDALFDVQIKRLHEYKRQHLNLLNILTQYRRLLQNPDLNMVPRVYVFGAKAAPGYELAKEIIHAINAVGEVINNDERIKDKIKVAFIPNYRVSAAEVIIPAADLSEQISTAGKEASGTGNMKLALNGALTIGTLDGANVEIGEEVGDDNIFIFGLTVEEVEVLWASGYCSIDYYWKDEELREIIDWISSDSFAPRGTFAGIRNNLLDGGDPYLALADYRAYVEAQAEVDEAFKDEAGWAKKAILNTARVGKFSSDRTIREYAEEIWNLPSVKV
ncbi:glycogen/starch/alpha-glucan phosphorylase [Verrucomicrobiales bacterium]|jgi:starch phosphorylase|nr:glycogen/starch/alpha-glucan phosphorylase [Verrucomicrobiales bacterium]MDB3941115.1 glycogen/starch/alpha-glucan phosphorylase [Verrucomicrobiales bacterium]MDC0263009.1 glycogen/starch/alpha-glucan phosphorylase [Verrucomicrobiales bacterium]